jgi:hypothetical protein
MLHDGGRFSSYNNIEGCICTELEEYDYINEDYKKEINSYPFYRYKRTLGIE